MHSAHEADVESPAEPAGHEHVDGDQEDAHGDRQPGDPAAGHPALFPQRGCAHAIKVGLGGPRFRAARRRTGREASRRCSATSSSSSTADSGRGDSATGCGAASSVPVTPSSPNCRAVTSTRPPATRRSRCRPRPSRAATGRACRGGCPSRRAGRAGRGRGHGSRGCARRASRGPAHRDRAQQRDQRRRGGQHDVLRPRPARSGRARPRARRTGTPRRARTAPRTPASPAAPASTPWRTSASTCARSCRA